MGSGRIGGGETRGECSGLSRASISSRTSSGNRSNFGLPSVASAIAVLKSAPGARPTPSSIRPGYKLDRTAKFSATLSAL